MSYPTKHRLRYEIANQPRFITFSCVHRLNLFENDRIKQAFVCHLEATRADTQFDLLAWVLMPEHVHLILVPPLPEITLSTVLEQIKGPFAKQVLQRWRELDARILNRITDRRGRQRFWQRGGGYDRNVRDENELHEKIAYIHDNPRRRRLVESSTEWPWSSARYYAGQRDNILPCESNMT